MEKNSGVHMFYKNLGETPGEAVLRFKKENPEYDFLPITYAGRLDPMAEGLLILLSEGALKEKEKYLGLPKTYEFEILWCFQTDSLDILGEIVNVKLGEVGFEHLKEAVQKKFGKFEQLYPAYSSRPVGGKSLFEWAREGKINEIEIPKHEVEIYNSELIERRTMSGEDLLKEIKRRIMLVNGDFRQETTIKKWEESIKGKEKEIFTLDKFRIDVSSGFYVRQFVTDLGQELSIPATVFHIKRIKVGEYDVAKIS